MYCLLAVFSMQAQEASKKTKKTVVKAAAPEEGILLP
jgi:hypothetical protein